MSVFRGLTTAAGEIRLNVLPNSTLPVGARQRRGLWVTMDDTVLAIADTGQDRIFQGGVAFERASGLLLVNASGIPGPIPMDGMYVTSTGALIGKDSTGDVVHQGVSLTSTDRAGIVIYEGTPVMTFRAPLQTGVLNTQGEGDFSRNTLATYQDSEGILRQALAGEPRFEATGILVEQASTNKCTNYNANPDEGLTNISTPLSDPAFVLSRVPAPVDLKAAGLHVLCSSGYILRADNSAASASSFVVFAGGTGNLNSHCLSVYWRGSGQGRISMTQSTHPDYLTLPGSFTRHSIKRTPGQTTSVLFVEVTAGSVAEFVLNQMEETDYLSSVIVTEGASASRSADVLEWPLAGILNQTEGMLALRWRPGYSADDIPTWPIWQRIVVYGSTSQPMYMAKQTATQTNFWANDVSTSVSAPDIVGGLAAGVEYLVVTRWSGTQYFIGHKVGGAWLWSSPQTYDGNFDAGSVLQLLPMIGQIQGPSHSRDLMMWSNDAGQAWIESYFSGVAN